MATFGFTVNIAWKGDEDQGKEMEKIVRAAFKGSDDDAGFLDEDIDQKQVKNLRKAISERMYKKIPITKEFDECDLFGKPRTMYFRWEENQNFAPDCFAPLFEFFPGLEFWAAYYQDYVSSDDSYRYMHSVYKNGAAVDRQDQEYDSYDEYAERCGQGEREQSEWLGLPEEVETEELSISNGDFEIVSGVLKKYTGKDNAVIVPEGVRAIGEDAFCPLAQREQRGDLVTSVYIPASVEEIGEDPYEIYGDDDPAPSAFSNCRRLKSIEVSPQNKAYSSVKGILYDKTVKTLLYYPEGSEVTEVHIPNTVRKIACCAFDSRERLTAVHIPDSVRAIGEGAFYKCGKLSSVFISDTPRKIGEEAFEWCTALDEETCRKLRSWGYKGKIGIVDALDFLRKNPGKFQELPLSLRTREVCLFAVESFGNVCQFIPDALCSEDFFLEAVRVNKNGKALKYVPEEYRTEAVCLAALTAHPDMAEELLGYTPEALREQVKQAAGIAD